MPQAIKAGVAIGAQILRRHSVGGTIEERFKNIVKPGHLSEGCFMCGSEDEEFLAAVGGLLLSYDDGTPERKRIEREVQALAQVSTMLTAASLGMNVNLPESDPDFKAVGLIGLWHTRERR